MRCREWIRGQQTMIMTASRWVTVSSGVALATFSACVTTEQPNDRSVWVNPKTTTATYDPAGRETSGEAIGSSLGLAKSRRASRVEWSQFELEEAARAADAAARAPQDPEQSQDPKAVAARKQQQENQAKQEARRRREALIRTSFGNAVIIGDDGRITKQYPLTAETGHVFLKLLTPFGNKDKDFAPEPGQKFGGEELDTILGRMLGKADEIEIVYIPDFEHVENFTPPLQPNQQAQPKPSAQFNSLLMVTATPSSLSAFEHALNLFFANMPQIEIEVKVVEYNSTDSLSIGVQPLNANTPTLTNLSTGRLIKDITSDFAMTAPTFGSRSSSADLGSIVLGGIHDSWELNAVLQLLETRGSVDIQTQPRLVVRNGGLATIASQSDLPYPKARFSNNANVVADIVFKPVGMVMHIRPEIAGTDTVTLLIDASVSAVTDFAATEPPTPIVATRHVTTSLHLRAGETTVIGGLVSQSMFESETKIPLLGDIPILGYLFRSTTTQTQRTTLEFWITPRILSGPRGQRPEGLGGF